MLSAKFRIVFFGLLVSFTMVLPIFAQPKLPSGPAGSKPFGAYYTKLTYSADWDKPWRVGSHADVVVCFDEFPFRLVFWRGTSYCPCWVSENGIWYSNEWWETSEMHDHMGFLVWNPACTEYTIGGCEPLFDKQARYSHVRVIENHNARIVIHWRYALCDMLYRLPYVDPETDWGDWADEYYIIYPDGTCLRKATCWSTKPEGGWKGIPEEGVAHRECHESIVINQPGTRPDDNIETGAVTLANLTGQEHTYEWNEGAPPFNQLANPCLQMINLKAACKPFEIVEPEGAIFQPFWDYAGFRHAHNSNFLCWDHWPVAQEKSDVHMTLDYNRPSHSSLCHIIWPPAEKTKNSITNILLTGMTVAGTQELVVLARSWINPPALQIQSTNDSFVSAGYDKSQRSYVLERKKNDQNTSLTFRLEASENSPILNPAFIVKNWGTTPVSLKINDQLISQGKDFRMGYAHSLESSDLVLWIKTSSNQPLSFELSTLNR
jgi:hypothetical protein